MFRFSFACAGEARRRAALLFLHSLQPSLPGPVRLVPARAAVDQLFATLLQSVFRGFLTRRWFRALQAMLQGHLGTDILSEREASWASQGQRVSSLYTTGVRQSASGAVRGGGPAGGPAPVRADGLPSGLVKAGHATDRSSSAHAHRPGRAQSGASPVPGRSHSAAGVAVERIGADVVMQLQAHNLRLAGLRPASSLGGGAGGGGGGMSPAMEERLLAAKCMRWQLLVNSDRRVRTESARLEERKGLISEERDRQRLLTALRSRSDTLPLRQLKQVPVFAPRHVKGRVL